MENIITKITTTTGNYNCAKWKDNSTRITPGQLKCKKWQKVNTTSTTRQQNQVFIDTAFKRMSYVDYFLTVWILLLFFLIIIRKFFNK